MKVKLLTIFILLALAFVTVVPTTVHAQAYDASFITSITYQNVGTAPTTTLNIHFYATQSTTVPITIPRPNLANGASTSVFIGSVSEVVGPFEGSAVMESDQPLLATLVQVPQGGTVIVRPLSNGFSDGSATALIATFLKNMYGSSTKFSIQNIDSQANNVNFKFYDTGANMVYEFNQTIQPGASYYVKANSLSALGASFNGSAVVTAKRVDNSDGKIIGSAMELDISGIGAKAFESVAAGANTIYMPSALCNAFGSQVTSYAVQNTSLSASADVTVTFNPGGLTAHALIGPGAKSSFPACSTVSSGFVGSAVVQSTGAPVVAMGKASGGGLSTAFLGAASGAASVALPYVRWAPDANYNSGSYQRTFLAIQNVGLAAIPPDSITITYTDSFGHTGTHVYHSTLEIGQKFNSNASNAGLSWFGTAEPPASGFGGGAIITCTAPGCQLIAIGRVQTFIPSNSTVAAEDYNGMPTP